MIATYLLKEKNHKEYNNRRFFDNQVVSYIAKTLIR